MNDALVTTKPAQAMNRLAVLYPAGDAAGRAEAERLVRHMVHQLMRDSGPDGPLQPPTIEWVDVGPDKAARVFETDGYGFYGARWAA